MITCTKTWLSCQFVAYWVQETILCERNGREVSLKLSQRESLSQFFPVYLDDCALFFFLFFFWKIEHDPCKFPVWKEAFLLSVFLSNIIISTEITIWPVGKFQLHFEPRVLLRISSQDNVVIFQTGQWFSVSINKWQYSCLLRSNKLATFFATFFSTKLKS